MTRLQLEHVIRAASAIANDADIVVIGSPVVPGQMEADVYPRHHPERSDLIDGSIGEGSPFQNTFGYFAHGIDPTTAVLPNGWESRLIRVENPNTAGARGWCLEAHDLAIAKHVAGREKDIDYTAALASHGMIERQTLLERLSATPIDPELREIIRTRVNRQCAATLTPNPRPAKTEPIPPAESD
jgi:hypothetical protein